MPGSPRPDLKAVLDAIKPEGWVPRRESREWCALGATASAAAYLSAVRAHTGAHMDTTMTTTGIPSPTTHGAFSTSSALDLLAVDLAAAQAEMQGAVKGTTNTFFHSEYADLASVWRACRGPLTSHGLSVVQMPVSSTDGSVGVVTILLHKSGQWIKSECSAHPKDAGPQATGSVITYLRRYALAGVGIPQVDDDGEAGEGGHVKAAPAHATPTPTPAPTRRAPVKPAAAAPAPAPFQAGEAPWETQDEPEPGSFDGPGNEGGAGVRVTTFRRATSKPGSATTWSAGFVTLENGLDGGSFDEAVIATLEAAFKQGVPVLYTAEPSKRDPKKMTITAADFAANVAM